MRCLLVILLMALTLYNAQAQDNETDVLQRQTDSILSLVTPSTPDSLAAKYYGEIGMISISPDTVIKYSLLSLEKCGESDLRTKASNYGSISWAYYMKDDSKKALPYSFMAVKIWETLGDKPMSARNYISIAKRYHELNFKDSIFYFFNKALAIYTELKDTMFISYTYRSIGEVNSDLGFHKTAMEYYCKALRLDSLSGDYLSMADDYEDLGLAASDGSNNRTALEYLKKSVAIFDTANVTEEYFISSKYIAYRHLAASYIEEACVTGKREYADSCYFYIQKIQNRYHVLGEYDTHIQTQICYSKYLSFSGKNKEALGVMLDCQKFLDETEGKKTLLAEYYKRLTEIYKSLGEYEKAVASLEKMHHYKISFTNDSTVRVIADFQAEQAGRIKDLEHERVLENNAAEKRQLNTVIISLAVCLVIVSLSVFFIIRVLRIKYKANKELVLKNEILNRQKSEIEIQKAVITGQWQEVEEINHKLFNSIHYAKRIQGAAISPKTEVDALFPDNFIYYRPRDIVSGDYYRVAKCGRYNVFITADCTGHGIPGAFLSMLGISALKEYCVSEEDGANPGTVLDRMRSFIKSTLNSGSGKVIDDGMDMTICSFDFENMELRYAMANQTAYIIRKGEIIKLKGDRMPVGRYIVEKEHFTSYTLPLEKGDVVYTFSDGIPDQLGGELKSGMERKFLSKNLVAFLKEIYLKPFEEQNMLLDKEITAWRDGRPQVDDITLIGVRV